MAEENKPDDDASVESVMEVGTSGSGEMPSVKKQIAVVGVIIVIILALLGGGLLLSQWLS
jgi:hypothetical protein